MKTSQTGTPDPTHGEGRSSASRDPSSTADATPGAATPTTARIVIAAIAVLLLLSALDQTIVSTALPTIVADLGGLDHLSWVVTAYILTSTIAAPLYGKLGDLYGRRRMVFISVAVFLTGSVLCGMAGSMEFLIFARALQGLGGGGLFVLALSIVADVIPPRERGKVQGIFAAVFSISSVVGPLMGGVFVEHFSWRWIFYINLPLGIAALIAFAIGFKPTGKRASHSIDYLGAVTLSVGLGALVLFTSLGGNTLPWSSPASLALLGLSLAALAAFAFVETRAAEPILPLNLFRDNVFTVTSAIGFVAGAAMMGSITFMPLFLQIAKGVSPTISGLQLIPMTAGILISSNVAGRYMGRTGRYRILPIFGTTALAIGMALLSTMNDTTPYPLVGFYLGIVGLGMGCIFPVVTTAVQNAVPRALLGTATAAGLMFRQIGGTLAVALFGALFTARMSLSLGGLPENVTGEIGPQMLEGLPESMREQVVHAVVYSLQPIYLIAAGIAVAGILLSLILKEIPLVSRMVPKGE